MRPTCPRREGRLRLTTVCRYGVRVVEPSGMLRRVNVIGIGAGSAADPFGANPKIMIADRSCFDTPNTRSRIDVCGRLPQP